MDQSWMYNSNQTSPSFMNVHFEEFLDFIGQDMKQRGGTEICCLSHICKNTSMFTLHSSSVKAHLKRWDFMHGYTWWKSHAEEEENRVKI